MAADPSWITPQWPAPAHVRAVSTTRLGGVSLSPYGSLNLATHVGDDPAAVAKNRELLRAAFDLAAEPAWLEQVHGVNVVDAAELGDAETARADASVAHRPARPCVVMTADCLPVLFCDRAGTRVAAAHAGWRGLAQGVLEATVRELKVVPSELLAWLGPAIEAEVFEVGDEVRTVFLTRGDNREYAFVRNDRGRWMADLYALARMELEALGVGHVSGGDERCFADRTRFFSFRRDGATGRMATMVWLAC